MSVEVLECFYGCFWFFRCVLVLVVFGFLVFYGLVVVDTLSVLLIVFDLLPFVVWLVTLIVGWIAVIVWWYDLMFICELRFLVGVVCWFLVCLSCSYEVYV